MNKNTRGKKENSEVLTQTIIIFLRVGSLERLRRDLPSRQHAAQICKQPHLPALPRIPLNIMAENLSNALIRVLRDHDIPCDRDAIKAALADPESQAAVKAYIEEYLSPETLLTKDEAAL
jgi:hypothetical protein